MTDILICPVCGESLTKEEHRYVCPRAHAYDIAKQGYVNLLGSKGGTHGDNALMVKSRRRFLDAGHYEPLVAGMVELLLAYTPQNAVLLDIGCGEGYYTAKAKEAVADRGVRIFAFDISKEAVKGAARRRAADTLFVAGAYKVPVATASVDLAMLFFSPFCREEILRVLKARGLLLMAYPAERHLYGLKAALYDKPYLNRPENPEILGFTVLDTKQIAYTVTLHSAEEIASLFMMTPYYYKTGKRDQEKLAALSRLETEIAFHLVLYRKDDL